MSTLKTSLSGEGIIKLLSQVYLASEISEVTFQTQAAYCYFSLYKVHRWFFNNNKIGTLKSLLHFENWEKEAKNL